MQVLTRPGGVASLSGLDWSAAAEVVNPDGFWSWQPFRVADDRQTRAGIRYARILYSGWRASLLWTVLPQAERDALCRWWEETDGWRLPSALRDGGVSYLVTAPTEGFPLAYIGGVPPHYSAEGPVIFQALQRL